DDSLQFPHQTFTFTEFNQLQLKIDKTDLLTDVIGILKDVDYESVIITTRNDNSPKRDLHIIDQAGHEIRITFWGKTIDQIPPTLKTSESNKIIVIITSTIVKKFEDMELPQIVAFKNTTPPTKSGTKRTLHQQSITPISEIAPRIAETIKPFSIVCKATITAGHHDQGFTKAVSKRSGSYWCYKCKELVDEPDIRSTIKPIFYIL
ncbi:hypothetical protein FRX31_009428, partial [Thalictrum thalictroides]